jgi:hypothetical protein
MEAALGAGRVVAVKLYLFVSGRPRPVGVELSTKSAKNMVDFDRSDPDVVAIVRGYLTARGILRDGLCRTGEARDALGPLPLFAPESRSAVS